jgi:hypothetical protein
MARFFITNRADVRAGIIARWGRAGLRFRETAGSLHAGAALKRQVAHENLRQEDGSRWLIATGSYGLFGGSWGGAALPVLSSSFSPSDPLALRPRLFGHYGVAVRRERVAFAFCDPIASYELFFTQKDGAFLVSTSLADCFCAPWVSGRLDEASALMAAFHGERGLGLESMVPGVQCVRGHQTVAMRQEGGVWSAELIQGPPEELPAEPSRFDDSVVDYADTTRRMLRVAKGAGCVAVNATGGLDSRTVLAAAGEAGMTGQLLYGYGNSAMTNTKRQDRLSARLLVRHLGAELTLMDWRQDTLASSNRRRELRRRHGFKLPYGGTETLLAAFDGGIAPYPDLQLAGYGSGFVNARIWSWKEDVSFDTFARRYAASYLDIFTTDAARETYLGRMVEDLRAIAAARGLADETDAIPPKDAVALWAFAKLSKESYNINAFNEYCYYLAPHLTSELLPKLLAVPTDWRRGDRYQLALIKQHDPDILSVPIYSGTRHYVLGRDGMIVHLLETRHDPRALLRRGMTKLAELAETREDRSGPIRKQLRRELENLCGEIVDPDRLAVKDARAVFRFITAREIGKDQAGAA